MEKNMSTGSTFLSEYYGDGNGRTATVLTSWQGLSVEFKQDGKVVETRMLHDHNRFYADDACENWVRGIIT